MYSSKMRRKTNSIPRRHEIIVEDIAREMNKSKIQGKGDKIDLDFVDGCIYD
jgi:hypothetical protein